MPQMNFDLEDGNPPVSFAVKTDDCERFMAFMAECEALKRNVNDLLQQIDVGDFVDCHGHSAKMLKPVHDLMRILGGRT